MNSTHKLYFRIFTVLMFISFLNVGCENASQTSASSDSEISVERNIAETTRRKKRKGTRRRKKRGRCPFGRGPLRRGKCSSSQKNAAIARLLGKRAASCYSALFVAESGSSCRAKTYHDPVKAANPHVGMGICAIETSYNVRKRNSRGPNCLAKNIKTSFERQVLCCRDMLEKTNSRYFGTILCGKTPNCKGLARGGGKVSGKSYSSGGSKKSKGKSKARFKKKTRSSWAVRRLQSKHRRAQTAIKSAKRKYDRAHRSYRKKKSKRNRIARDRAKKKWQDSLKTSKRVEQELRLAKRGKSSSKRKKRSPYINEDR